MRAGPNLHRSLAGAFVQTAGEEIPGEHPVRRAILRVDTETDRKGIEGTCAETNPYELLGLTSPEDAFTREHQLQIRMTHETHRANTYDRDRVTLTRG